MSGPLPADAGAGPFVCSGHARGMGSRRWRMSGRDIQIRNRAARPLATCSKALRCPRDPRPLSDPRSSSECVLDHLGTPGSSRRPCRRRDHDVEPLPEKLLHRLRPQPCRVNRIVSFQGGPGSRVDRRPWLAAGAEHVDALFRELTKQCFGHLRSCRIAGAEKQDS
jgi:hypothetical protein